MIVFEKRIEKAKKMLKEVNLDGLLVTNNSNIFYLTGLSEFPTEEQDARIIITKNEIYLLTDFRYTEGVQKKAPFLQLVEISYNNSLVQALKKIVSSGHIKTIGFEGHSLTVNELSMLTANFTSQKFQPIEKYIEQLRIQKDPQELTAITNACTLTDQAFKYIVRHVKSGVTEKNLAWEIEKFIKEHGGTLAFPSIVAFGNHSAIPHHSPDDTRLSKNEEIILFDLGAKVDGYASDMTRTIFIKTPSKRVSDAYNTLFEIQNQAIKEVGNYLDQHFKTGSVAINVNARLQEKGYLPVPHGLGHGVGIDVHEAPILSPMSENKLHKNMIVTVEPGIYIPGKFGMRIEDTVVLEDRARPLTQSPKKLMVITLTD